MPRIWIDGNDYPLLEGESVLQVARRCGLSSIPSLCHHPAFQAEAACRMCVVELEGANAAPVTACTLPAQDGLRVRTDTAAVRAARSRILALIAGKACILCGLCVNACALLGLEAIQFTGKGSRRQVELVLDAGQSPCIGCQACLRLCAVQDHAAAEKINIRALEGWLSGLAPAVCTACGQPYAPQAALALVVERLPAVRARSRLCPACRRAASIPARLRQSNGT